MTVRIYVLYAEDDGITFLRNFDEYVREYGVTPQKTVLFTVRNEFSSYFVKYSLYQNAFQRDIADCNEIYTLPHAVTLNIHVTISVFEIPQSATENIREV